MAVCLTGLFIRVFSAFNSREIISPDPMPTAAADIKMYIACASSLIMPKLVFVVAVESGFSSWDRTFMAKGGGRETGERHQGGGGGGGILRDETASSRQQHKRMTIVVSRADRRPACNTALTLNLPLWSRTFVRAEVAAYSPSCNIDEGGWGGVGGVGAEGVQDIVYP